MTKQEIYTKIEKDIFEHQTNYGFDTFFDFLLEDLDALKEIEDEEKAELLRVLSASMSRNLYIINESSNPREPDLVIKGDHFVTRDVRKFQNPENYPKP